VVEEIHRTTHAECFGSDKEVMPITDAANGTYSSSKSSSTANTALVLLDSLVAIAQYTIWQVYWSHFMDNKTYSEVALIALFKKALSRALKKAEYAKHTTFQGVSCKHIRNLLLVKNHIPATSSNRTLEHFDKSPTKGNPAKRKLPATTPAPRKRGRPRKPTSQTSPNEQPGYSPKPRENKTINRKCHKRDSYPF
jgi:hypothetical protein